MATYEWTGATDGDPTDANNYDPTSGPPTTGDTLIFNHKAVAAMDGADLSAITLAYMLIMLSCQYDIGTTATPLKIGATLVDIGIAPQNGGSFNGPNNVILDLHTIQTKVTVYNTGSGTPNTGKENVRIKGSHASNELYVVDAVSLGIATNIVGDAARFPTIGIGGGTVNLGDGITNTPAVTVNDRSAQVSIRCAHSLTLIAGTVTTSGDFTLTTATLLGGTLVANHRKSGGVEITTLNQRGGDIDTSGNPEAFAVTTHNKQRGKIVAFSPTQWTVTTETTTWGDYTAFTHSAS